MAMGKRRGSRWRELWVEAASVAQGPAHPAGQGLQRRLDESQRSGRQDYQDERRPYPRFRQRQCRPSRYCGRGGQSDQASTLCVRHRTLVSALHDQRGSEKLGLEHTPFYFYVHTTAAPW